MSQPAEVTNEEVQTADVLPFFLFEYSMEIGASPVKLHSDSSLTSPNIVKSIWTQQSFSYQESAELFSAGRLGFGIGACAWLGVARDFDSRVGK